MQRVRHRPDPPEVERAANGLRVRGHALYLEPRGRPPLGFLAHARGAPSVLPERMVASGPTHKLLEAALPRALRRSAALAAAFGQTFALGSLRLTLHPAGHVLGVPPTLRLARLDLGPHRICALSGRAVDGIAGADEALPLADHAGVDELIQCIRASGAKRVLTIDGHAEDLARAARALGIDAMAIREQHQLSLPGL